MPPFNTQTSSTTNTYDGFMELFNNNTKMDRFAEWHRCKKKEKPIANNYRNTFILPFKAILKMQKLLFITQ